MILFFDEIIIAVIIMFLKSEKIIIGINHFGFVVRYFQQTKLTYESIFNHHQNIYVFERKKVNFQLNKQKLCIKLCQHKDNVFLDEKDS